MAMIHEALAAIMAEVPAISKDRENKQQGFRYRGIEDVYAAVHPLFVKHGVFSVPTVLSERSEERTTKSGSALIYRILQVKYTFFAKDGSFIESVVIGEGMDSGDKASNKALAVAHKYSVVQILSIPVEESDDPDAASHDVQPRNPPPARPSSAPASAPAPGMGAFVALVNTMVPDAEKPEWMKRARTCKTPEDFAGISVELRARYAGKEA